MKKKTIITIIVIVLVAIAAFWFFLREEENGEAKYKTLKVERGMIEEKVTATGRIEALVTVSVGSQVSGTIKELLADFNSVVKKNQVIALLEPSIFEAQKKQAEANLASARSNLDKSEVALVDAERNLKRGEELSADKLISQSDLDALKTARDSAAAQLSVSKAQVKQADAALALANVNLDHTIITSPIDGVVISRDVDVGQTVAASLQAPTLFTIANDLTKMQVHSDIAESDVGKVRTGESVTFKVDAFPNETFKGTVSQVRNQGTIVQNVVTYDAVVDVENKDLKLKPGMTAYVSILIDKKDNALKIPNIALRFKPSNADEINKAAATSTAAASAPSQGSAPHGVSGAPLSKGESAKPSFKNPVVWILRNGKDVPVTIKTGITDGKYSEVVEGDLSDGDEVITEELNPGNKGTGTMPGFGRGFH